MNANKDWKSYLQDPLFQKCLRESAANKELVQQLDRLRGTNLGLRGKPIELAIDQATGNIEQELEMFIEFVHEYVYKRVYGPEGGSGGGT